MEEGTVDGRGADESDGVLVDGKEILDWSELVEGGLSVQV